MLCPVKSIRAPHRPSACRPRPTGGATIVVTRAAHDNGHMQPQPQPPAAAPAKQRVYMVPGQYLTTTVVKHYQQMLDGGMSAEAALACIENTEYVVPGRVEELQGEVRKLGAKVDDSQVQQGGRQPAAAAASAAVAGRNGLQPGPRQAASWSKADSFTLYALIALIVLRVLLIEVDTFPHTALGTILRRLVG